MNSTISTPANETNGLIDGAAYHQRMHDESIDATAYEVAKSGGKFTRIRLLTEPGYPYMDVSYIHAQLGDGTPVRVNIDFDASMLLRRTYRSQLRDALVRDSGLTRREAEALGVWEEGVYSVLR
jgi:hypothetical protein